MSSSSRTTIAVLISVILAVSAFLVIARSQPVYQVKVTAEQALNILRESGKTDHFITNQISPESIKLEYTSINWLDYLRDTGYHTSLYVSTSPVGEVKPYWIIDYNDTSTVNLGGAPIYGRYVVDAHTGEVMLSLRAGADYGSQYSLRVRRVPLVRVDSCLISLISPRCFNPMRGMLMMLLK